jgi:hypothetical protein
MRRAAGVAAALVAAGCAATVREVHRHPQQDRLERLLAEVPPHTKYPDKHYWVRAADPSKDRIGLAVLPQRHVYLAQALVEEADDGVLRALIVHAVAHHRLHHYTERNVMVGAQQAAFKAGGQFVPGLSKAHYIGGPVIEYAMGPPQERGADRKTLVYLKRMGAPAEDYARALELLAARDLAERIGRTTIRGKRLRARAARVRKIAARQARTAAAMAPIIAALHASAASATP